MIVLEKRRSPSRIWGFATPLLAVLATMVAGGLLFAALGKDPFLAIRTIFWDPLFGDFASYTRPQLLIKAGPLILIAVGLSFGFRAGIWNIGAEGQFLIGAVAGGGIAVATHGTDAGHWVLPAMLIVGAAAGALYALIPAFCKVRFGASEILVSLMLVYVAEQLLFWLVFGPWKDPMGFNFPQTKTFVEATWLPLLIPRTRLHAGFVLTVILVAAFWAFMARSWRGYQLQVGGLAPAAARYAGFSSRRALWTSMLVCGALAGVAGVGEVIGPIGQLTPSVSPGYGFAAIIVAYVGRLHPLGVVFSSFIMALFYIGGELAQSRLGLPSAITGVFQGMLLFFLLGADVLIGYRVRWSK